MKGTTFIRGPGQMLPIPELKRRMLVQRRALFEQVTETEEDLRWLGTNVEPELEEEGQEENLARLLVRLDDLGKAEIATIDRALARIATGDYGRCASCRKPIPAARLTALPTAEECLPCAKRGEVPR